MKILLLGSTGQVGFELQRALAPLGELVAPGRESVDLERPLTVRQAIREARPDVVVNAAAYTAVDRAEAEVALARRVNYEAVEVMAEEAHSGRAWLVHYSTDYVFDGKQETPYVEDDPVNPLSVYGKTKWEGEQAVRAHHDRHIILRTSWVYGAWGNNFVKTILRLAREREELSIVADQHGAPTSAELIADITALVLYRIYEGRDTGLSLAGTYHLAAAGETTWFDYARYVVEVAAEYGVALKTAPDRIHPVTTEAFPLPATRPKNALLDASKLKRTFKLQPPDWRSQVARLLRKLTTSESI